MHIVIKEDIWASIFPYKHIWGKKSPGIRFVLYNHITQETDENWFKILRSQFLANSCKYEI